MVQALKLKMKEQKGFTLIELLAVIVILGIIAAVAIPAIGNVIKNSDDKAKVQDALLIIDGAKLLVADNPPTAATSDYVVTSGADDAGSAGKLTQYLDRYKDSDKTFTVRVTKDASTGKYSYSISGHDANALGGTPANPSTEDQLLSWKK